MKGREEIVDFFPVSLSPCLPVSIASVANIFKIIVLLYNENKKAGPIEPALFNLSVWDKTSKSINHATEEVKSLHGVGNGR